MIGQRRVDERFLPVEGFRRTAAGEPVSVKVSLDDLREKFGNRAQAEPVAPISPIQRFSEHKLPAVRVVAQIQPVIYFTPIRRTLRNCAPSLPGVDAADYDVHAV